MPQINRSVPENPWIVRLSSSRNRSSNLMAAIEIFIVLGLGRIFFGVGSRAHIFVEGNIIPGESVGEKYTVDKFRTDIAPIKKIGLSEGMRTMKKLSRRLRGDRADPVEVIPQIHDVIKTQLANVESMQNMYKDGNGIALTTSIKSLINEIGKIPKSQEDEKKDLALLDNLSDWNDVPDYQLIDQFDPKNLSIYIEQLQHLEKILGDFMSMYQSPILDAPRRKKDNFFSDKSSGSTSFDFNRRASQKGRNFNRGMMKKMLRRAKAEYYNAQCAPNDPECMCLRLSNCVKAMNHYDLALLFGSGYVDEDSESSTFAEFTVDDDQLKLFDVQQNAYGKFKKIIDTANSIDTNNTEKCVAFLDEFHSSCNPHTEMTCTKGNVRTFQLSVDEVCDGINNPTKILFSAIGDKFDGYASDDGLVTYTSTCGQYRVAFESCRAFIEDFETLYNVRNSSKYPFPNPMRSDPKLSIGRADEGTIFFPSGYKFDQDLYGIASLALPDISSISTFGKDIRVVANLTKCMDSKQGNIYMQDCLGSDNQMFYYDTNTYQIKQDTRGSTRCLDYDSGSTNNVYLNPTCTNGLNQKWRFNALTLELTTFIDNNCLDWNKQKDSNLYMHPCYGNKNQQFKVPKKWFPGISTGTLNQVRVVSKVNVCMDSGNGGDDKSNIYMSECYNSIGTHNQNFTYDANTHQIKQYTPQGLRCLDHDSNGGKVYMNKCLYVTNQYWRYSSITMELKTFRDDNCLHYNATDHNKLYIHECTSAEYQKFQIPFQWMPAISTTSILSSVRVLVHGNNYCMSGSKTKLTLVTTRGCDNYDNDQNWFYNATSRQVMNGGLCLDAKDTDSDNGAVYINECNSGLNQQWHYDLYSRQLRHLSADHCLDSNGANGAKMLMERCNNGENQQFFIPLTWLPAAEIDKIRVLQQGGKCMGVRPNYNNNVWMADCQTGNAWDQVFFYDSRTLAIKHSGLCLDRDSKNNNVFLRKCDAGSDNQKWIYDSSNMKLHNVKNNNCLVWNDAENENNLYVYKCTDASNQKWIIPSRWKPAIEDTKRHGSSHEFQLAGYFTRPIPTGIWNGEWNSQKGEHCSVDVMKDVIDTCDKSISFLLGDLVSVGTLRDITKQIKKNGPDYMPGTCCLDNPSNSEWFGFYYNAGVTYFNSSMECQNPGPWHLGISKESCSSVGGYWFRSPCLTLQKCINNRPTPDETGYSQSFEDFALGLVIQDASNETQCSKSRKGLGFDGDYPHDTDICERFIEQECSDFFTDVDALTGSLDPKYTTTSYNETQWITEIPFTNLPSPGWKFQNVDLTQDKADQLADLQNRVLEADFEFMYADMDFMFYTEQPKCDDKYEKTIKEGSVSIPNLIYRFCEIEQMINDGIQRFILVSYATTKQTLDTAYAKATLSPSQEYDTYYYSQTTYQNLKSYHHWINDALTVINQNIDQQHNWMGEKVCDVAHGMGGKCKWKNYDNSHRLRDSEKNGEDGNIFDSSSEGYGIVWQNGTLAQRMTKIENFMKRIEVFLHHPQNGSKGSKRIKKTIEGDSNRHLMELEEIGVVESKVVALGEKVDEHMSSLRGKVGEKMESLEGRMSSLEDKVDMLSSMLSQLIDQNERLLYKMKVTENKEDVSYHEGTKI